MNVIEVSNIAKNFGRVWALRNASFVVERGGVYGYLGHNGAGKTTTLRIILGIYRPTKGVVRVMNRDPYDDKDVLKLVSYVSENNGLHPKLTVVENLRYFAKLYNAESEVRRVLEEFELEAIAKTKFEKLSAGMKRRVAIARAFLKNPEIVLLDEPFVNLDPMWRNHIKSELLRISREQRVAILLTTHILEDVEQLCSSVIVIKQGVTLFHGSMEKLSELVGKGIRTYELSVSNPELAAKLVHTSTGIDVGAEVNNNILIVNVPQHVNGDAKELIADIVELLVKNGIRVYGVYERRLSLNEIYEALHRWDPGGCEVKHHNKRNQSRSVINT